MGYFNPSRENNAFQERRKYENINNIYDGLCTQTYMKDKLK